MARQATPVVAQHRAAQQHDFLDLSWYTMTVTVTDMASQSASVHDDGGATDPLDPSASCELMGPLGLVLQLVLAVVAFSTLVFKRYHEKPQRPFKVWLYDASKQAIGQFLFHMLNIIVSIALGSENADVDSCVWYFLTVMLDTTIGVLVMAVLLAIVDYVVQACRWTDLYTGDYGRPPRFHTFMKQLAVFLVLVVVVKMIMMSIMMLPFLHIAAQALLEPISSNKNAELVVVMIITPLIMNSIQFWIVDQVLKRRDKSPGGNGGAMSIGLSTRSRPGVYDDEEEVSGLMVQDGIYGIDEEL